MSKIRDIFDFIYDFYNSHKVLINTILIVLLFLVMYCTFLTRSYYEDDFFYSLKWMSKEPLGSFSDIVEFQIQHYFNWGGRTVAHFALQVLLLLGKPISSFVLTSLYFVLAYLVDISYYLLILGLLYYLNPFFNETILWVTGACNYLLTTTIILTVMFPFVKYVRNEDTGILPALAVMLSLLSGWTNENMGG